MPSNFTACRTPLACTAEMEVSPDAQRFDGYFVPHRAHAARRRDLLDRLITHACAFEAFRAAPSPAEIEGCVRKNSTPDMSSP